MKKWIALLFVLNLAVFVYFNFALNKTSPAKPTPAANAAAEIKLLSPAEIAALPEKPVTTTPAITPNAPQP